MPFPCRRCQLWQGKWQGGSNVSKSALEESLARRGRGFGCLLGEGKMWRGKRRMGDFQQVGAGCPSSDVGRHRFRRVSGLAGLLADRTLDLAAQVML